MVKRPVNRTSLFSPDRVPARPLARCWPFAACVRNNGCSTSWCSATAHRSWSNGNGPPHGWAWSWSAGLASRETLNQADGLLLTYQSAGRQPQQLAAALDPWPASTLLAIADEAHHLGLDPEEPGAAAWSQTFEEQTSQCRLRLGLTGTPFRADNLGFCAARRIRTIQNGELVEQIQPDLCVEPRELIAAGDVRPLEFHFQDGWVEHSQEGRPDRDVSPLSQEQRESWRARNLRRAIRLADSSCIGQQVILQAQRRLARVRQQQPNAAGLVIARDIEHASAIATLLEDDGDRVDLVHSQDPEAAARLDGFQAGGADWLVSIDMCAEGFDAPRLRVVAYLTTVVTRSRFLQGITRAVRMTPELAGQEPVPRNPSYVVAPADPLLMGYARSWSVAEPYVLTSQDSDQVPLSDSPGHGRGPSLPAGGGQRRRRSHDPTENAATAVFFAALTTSFCREKCEFLRNQTPNGDLDPSFCSSLGCNHGRCNGTSSQRCHMLGLNPNRCPGQGRAL